MIHPPHDNGGGYDAWAIARERAKAAGLADRVSFELMDYRAMGGQFDRIVSVGMFEHVGAPNFGTFFDVVRDRLVEDGVALIHTIGRTAPPNATNPWIAKYIFPGGNVPSLSEVVKAIQDTGLRIGDIECLRLHYAMTLRCWFDRFSARADVVATLETALELRVIDVFDEVGYLAAECALLGRPDLGDCLVQGLTNEGFAPPSAELQVTYAQFRLVTRARLALDHLRDPSPATPEKWPVRARQYLTEAIRLSGQLPGRRGFCPPLRQGWRADPWNTASANRDVWSGVWTLRPEQ